MVLLKIYTADFATFKLYENEKNGGVIWSFKNTESFKSQYIVLQNTCFLWYYKLFIF